jgi:hypothetical protein
MISAYSFAIEALLIKEKKKVGELPPQIGVRIDIAKEIFKDDKMVSDNIEAFVFLKKLDKASYKKENEYRRHVRMIAKVEDKDYNIGIDEMTHSYNRLKEFLEYLEEKL